MQNNDQLDAFLFSSSQKPRMPNISNKTGEDLQDLIEEIPYPTEDLSLTSFADSTSSKPHTIKDSSKKVYYTEMGSDKKSQKGEKNLKSKVIEKKETTPNRINHIMDWSRNNVTPGNSKNIFPQVVAPSIEFSNENMAFMKTNEKSGGKEIENNLLEKLKTDNKRLENHIEIQRKIQAKTEKEGSFLANKIAELEEIINFLRGKYEDDNNLDDLRGELLVKSRGQILELKGRIREKENENEEMREKIEDLLTRMNNMEKDYQKIDEKNTEIEKHKTVLKGYRSKVSELETKIRELENLREIENTENLNKNNSQIEYIRELEEKIIELTNNEEFYIKKLEENKEILLKNSNTIQEKDNQLLEMKNIQEIFFSSESNQLSPELDKKIKNYLKFIRLTKGLNPTLYNQISEKISFGPIDLTESTENLLLNFEKNEINQQNLENNCNHRESLENFFSDIGYKEDNGEGIQNKSFEELLELLYGVFGNLHEQFETIYEERTELLKKIKFLEEKNEESEIERNNFEKKIKNIELELKEKSKKNEELIKNNKNSINEKIKLESQITSLEVKIEEIQINNDKNLKSLREKNKKLEEISKIQYKNSETQTKQNDCANCKVFSQQKLQSDKLIEEKDNIINKFTNEKSNFIDENKTLKETLKNKENEIENNLTLLKEKDRKNIDLFKENKILTEDFKKNEESLEKIKIEKEKVIRSLAQKTSEIKTLLINNKSLNDKNEELSKEISSLYQKIEEKQKEIEQKPSILPEKPIKNNDFQQILEKTERITTEFSELYTFSKIKLENFETKMKKLEEIKQRISDRNIFLEEENKILFSKIKNNNSIITENNEKTIDFSSLEMLSSDETIFALKEIINKIRNSREMKRLILENTDLSTLISLN